MKLFILILKGFRCGLIAYLIAMVIPSLNLLGEEREIVRPPGYGGSVRLGAAGVEWCKTHDC